MKLIKYNADYRDEFDCKGFGIMSDERWDTLVENARKLFAAYAKTDDEFQVCFGTNVWLEYKTFDAWLSDLKVIDIDDEQFNVLFTLFGTEWDDRDDYLSYGTAEGIFDIEEMLDFIDD